MAQCCPVTLQNWENELFRECDLHYEDIVDIPHQCGCWTANDHSLSHTENFHAPRLLHLPISLVFSWGNWARGWENKDRLVDKEWSWCCVAYSSLCLELERSRQFLNVGEVPTTDFTDSQSVRAKVAIPTCISFQFSDMCLMTSKVDEMKTLL